MKSAIAGEPKSLRRWLRQFPALVALKRVVFPPPQIPPESSTLNVLETVPLYVPFSAGEYKDVAPLTIQNVNLTFPFLGVLLKAIGTERVPLVPVEELPKNNAEVESANALKVLLDSYGSDKAGYHNYHYLYGPILKDRSSIKATLEIGMGTNFADVVSNMGAQGKPGASLRAFRDFLPNARIFGADVDKRILFQEERIETHYVDQTDLSTLDRLAQETPNDFDLIIDDGLHAPAANIAVLSFALKKVKIGGWIVIEDVPDRALPVWEVVAALLPSSYKTQVVKVRGANAFVVQRNA